MKSRRLMPALVLSAWFSLEPGRGVPVGPRQPRPTWT